MTAIAPALTTSETSLLIRASSACVAFGRRYSL